MCTFELSTRVHVPIELCAFAIVAAAVDGGDDVDGNKPISIHLKTMLENLHNIHTTVGNSVE